MDTSISTLVKLDALTAQRTMLNIWRGIAVAAWLISACLFIIFYCFTSATGVYEGTARYEELSRAFAACVFPLFIVFAFATFWHVWLQKRYRKQAAEKFVYDNGWLPNNEYRLEKVPSILLGASESRDQAYKFSGKYKGHTFTCLTFQFYGNIKTGNFICMSFKLSKAYPMIILDNRLNDAWRGVLSNLPIRLPRRSHLRLEGDFDRYYEVSTSTGGEHQAMQVLSPDIMAVLRDLAAHKVDIEIAGRDLFLMHNGEFYTERNITSLFTVADAILGELNELSRTWMESSKSEAKTIEQSAQSMRAKLIDRSYYATIATAVAILIYVVVVMVSRFW